MDYNKLVAVSGLSGLYELVSSKSDGAIVRSLEDKTTKFAASRTHRFSHLETIEIYTVNDTVNLAEIFKAMDADAATFPDVKNDKDVKNYFQKIYPEMDFDRVYASDMKKIIKWFEVLKKHNIEIKLTETEDEEKVENEIEAEVEEKPKAAKKEKKQKQETENEKTETPKAPAKKKAAKAN
jgi:septum formation inhibitor MinC